MIAFQAPAWSEMFGLDVSLIESFLRGSLIYLALVILFRVILKRQTGSLGLPDVMLTVLVSEAVSTAISAESKSIPNALVAASSLLIWNYSIDRLSHRRPWLHRLLEPEPLVLVKDGEPIRKNLDAEGISDDELAAQLRLNSIEDVSKVKLAMMESEGEVSVIPKQKASPSGLSAEPPTSEPPDFENAARRFLAVAAELQEVAAWHEERAAEHQASAKAARRILTRHGVRSRRTLTTFPSINSRESNLGDSKKSEDTAAS
jgi:uncharacterized membrane protein YcaP (DUF421 family)